MNLAHAKRMLAHLERQQENASASLSNPKLPLFDGLKVYLGTLTPSQQLALLMIGGGSLGKRVAARLAQSTVRPALLDYLALVRVGLAHQGKRRHVATPRGDRCARMLARALANDLKISTAPKPRLYRQVLGSTTTRQFTA